MDVWCSREQAKEVSFHPSKLFPALLPLPARCKHSEAQSVELQRVARKVPLSDPDRGKDPKKGMLTLNPEEEGKSTIRGAMERARKERGGKKRQ